MTDGAYRRERLRALLACLLLVVAYFLVPLAPDPNPARLALRAAGTLLVVGTVATLVTRQVRRQLTTPAGGPQARTLAQLVVGLVAGLLVFALADYIIAANAPRQFSGLSTRVDALYFALTTLTTIGYGDVHAQGQVARVVVCVQMLFSIGVIATGASIVVRQLTQLRQPKR
ncbi:potassium channel family protein [Micromonospora sp. DR5-3]|uniref:potassium channel family protein n=1 Tax=unclassified Micromonospora TaxID=2617518 RepID=UPI0011DC14B5|nr:MULTISPECIES: potassium channel family protein [unclassified Micromonospora]MCW3818415.1 potassium channel family protein [Micromonospora sp. DR5-3]TYC19544.1 two pore domain potassium channel family protein [Micromonospora sp. MP36]